MIKVKNNIRLYNKIMRKYWKRYAYTKHIKDVSHKVFVRWKKFCWIEHDMSCDYVKDNIKYLKSLYLCNPRICDDVVNYANKKVICGKIIRPEDYYLIGLQQTNEDFYYIIESGDRRVCVSCIGGIKLA